MTDRLHIEIGTIELTEIDEYEMDSDLLTAADAFSITIATPGTYAQRREFLANIRENGLRLYAYIQRSPDAPRALQMVGCIDKRSHQANHDAARLRLSGTDNGGQLTRASADPSLGVTAETSLIEMVRAVCEPFGIDVVTESAPSRTLCTGQRVSQDRDTLVIEHARSYGIPPSQMRDSLLERRALEGGTTLLGAVTNVLTDQNFEAISASTPSSAIVQTQVRSRRSHANGMTGTDVERLRISEAKPAVGETCWEFIDRHCRRLGVMPWIDARGRLIISSPDYDQDPKWVLHRLLGSSRDDSNILDGGVVEDYGALSSSCTVYGHTSGADAVRSPFRSTVDNRALQPFYRPLAISDPTVRSAEQAERAARRALGRQNEQAFVLEYELAGHGQRDLIFAIDTVADVLDEAIGVEGLFYVTARTLKCSRSGGARTRLRMIPLGAIVL